MPLYAPMNKPCNRPKSACGFTLIELLLVMSLMALATGLVAPKLFSAYEKIQMQSEEKEVASLLDAISYRAFIRNRPIKVILNEDTIYVAEKSPLKLKHIRFPETELNFIQSGFCDQTRIAYQVNDKTHFITLPTL